MEDQSTTKYGAVLMIDILGLKGIWKKGTHITVLSRLRQLEKSAHSTLTSADEEWRVLRNGRRESVPLAFKDRRC